MREEVSLECEGAARPQVRARRDQERARGRPGAGCTRGLVCRLKNTRVSHHRYAEAFRPSLRDSFTAYFVLFLVTGLCCHHPQCDAKHRHQVERQRRGVRTTRLRRPLRRRSPHDIKASIASQTQRPWRSRVRPSPGRDGAADASDLGSGSREKLRTRRSCERTDCWITSHAVNYWDETHGSLTPKEATRTGSVAMRAKADLLCSP
jgi:hypothetical protein